MTSSETTRDKSDFRAVQFLENMNLSYSRYRNLHFYCRIFLKLSSTHRKCENTKVLRTSHFPNCLEQVHKYSTVGLVRATAQLRKKTFRKKEIEESEHYGLKISAFCTAVEFDLNSITDSVKHGNQYILTEYNKEFADFNEVVHLVQPTNEDTESKDIFIFREGSIVVWNFSSIEISDLLQYLKGFLKDNVSEEILENENDFMPYIRSNESSKTTLKSGKVILGNNANETLEKFTISNAMAFSVLLGAYEALLDDYIHKMLPVTEDLKEGKPINMSKIDILKKMGQLFALRHVINLSSNLLDTPDFYWDHEELEELYLKTCNYFCIRNRTKVMNEKINHCIELVELLNSQNSDTHHIKLEWMIIVLIMIEVGFEIIHYVSI